LKGCGALGGGDGFLLFIVCFEQEIYEKLTLKLA